MLELLVNDDSVMEGDGNICKVMGKTAARIAGMIKMDAEAVVTDDRTE